MDEEKPIEQTTTAEARRIDNKNILSPTAREDRENSLSSSAMASGEAETIHLSKIRKAKVLRYSNSQINKYFEGVCNDILKHLDLSVNDLKKQKR